MLGGGHWPDPCVRVPAGNVLGRVHGATDIFYPMMIPERLGTAAMTIGAARPALEVATGYSSRRKAFGTWWLGTGRNGTDYPQ